MGRLKTTTTNYAFLAGRSFNTGYGYDAGSNRTGFTDPENGTNTYVYDTLNRLSSLASPQGTFGFGYDALGRRTSLTRPNAVNTTYGYDPLSRLLSIVHQKAGVTQDGATYTVDAVGNRTSKGDLQAGVTSNYTYDAIYELTKTMQGASTTETYSFDPVGNRLSSLGVSSYTTNASNQLTASSNATYTYDNNGNTLTKTDGTGTTTYTWDFENRLSNVILPGSGGTVNFKYDPLGRRIYKNSSLGTSVFAYDGGNFVEETNSTGGVIARYTQGLNIDEPLAMARSGATSYYHADGLGSITSLSDSTGASAATYTFDAFGNLTATTGLLNNPFMYTARDLDPETGLYYYRTRYYESSSGRFINEDPLGFNEGINFYAYVGNDPADLVDPTGLAKCCPSRYEKEIENGANNARKRLKHLRMFGTAVLPTDGPSVTIGGITGCSSGSVVKGTKIKVPDQYFIDIPVDPKKRPCTYECALAHERVHARMCGSMGGTRYNALTEAQTEIPAYMVELKCFLKMQ